MLVYHQKKGPVSRKPGITECFVFHTMDSQDVLICKEQSDCLMVGFSVQNQQFGETQAVKNAAIGVVAGFVVMVPVQRSCFVHAAFRT